MNLPLWQQPAPVQVTKPPVILNEAEAESLVAVTLKSLDAQGYCLWRCVLLRGEIMMLVRNDLSENIEARYPLYTLEEVERLAELQESTIRLIYHIKKQSGGAVITSV